MLKQMESKEVQINGISFYIRPISAFKAANLSGELVSKLTPIFAGLAPLLGGLDEKTDILNADISDPAVVSAISSAFSGIDGDEIEQLLRKLLLKQNTIAVKLEDEDGDSEVVPLDEDIANEVFCGEVQGMFVLAFEAIRVNYKGFSPKQATDLEA